MMNPFARLLATTSSMIVLCAASDSAQGAISTQVRPHILASFISKSGLHNVVGQTQELAKMLRAVTYYEASSDEDDVIFGKLELKLKRDYLPRNRELLTGAIAKFIAENVNDDAAANGAAADGAAADDAVAEKVKNVVVQINDEEHGDEYSYVRFKYSVSVAKDQSYNIVKHLQQQTRVIIAGLKDKVANTGEKYVIEVHEKIPPTVETPIKIKTSAPTAKHKGDEPSLLHTIAMYVSGALMETDDGENSEKNKVIAAQTQGMSKLFETLGLHDSTGPCEILQEEEACLKAVVNITDEGKADNFVKIDLATLPKNYPIPRWIRDYNYEFPAKECTDQELNDMRRKQVNANGEKVCIIVPDAPAFWLERPKMRELSKFNLNLFGTANDKDENTYIFTVTREGHDLLTLYFQSIQCQVIKTMTDIEKLTTKQLGILDFASRITQKMKYSGNCNKAKLRMMQQVAWEIGLERDEHTGQKADKTRSVEHSLSQGDKNKIQEIEELQTRWETGIQYFNTILEYLSRLVAKGIEASTENNEDSEQDELQNQQTEENTQAEEDKLYFEKLDKIESKLARYEFGYGNPEQMVSAWNEDRTENPEVYPGLYRPFKDSLEVMARRTGKSFTFSEYGQAFSAIDKNRDRALDKSECSDWLEDKNVCQKLLTNGKIQFQDWVNNWFKVVQSFSVPITLVNFVSVISPGPLGKGEADKWYEFFKRKSEQVKETNSAESAKFAEVMAEDDDSFLNLIFPDWQRGVPCDTCAIPFEKLESTFNEIDANSDRKIVVDEWRFGKRNKGILLGRIFGIMCSLKPKERMIGGDCQIGPSEFRDFFELANNDKNTVIHIREIGSYWGFYPQAYQVFSSPRQMQQCEQSMKEWATNGKAEESQAEEMIPRPGKLDTQLLKACLNVCKDWPVPRSSFCKSFLAYPTRKDEEEKEEENEEREQKVPDKNAFANPTCDDFHLVRCMLHNPKSCNNILQQKYGEVITWLRSYMLRLNGKDHCGEPGFEFHDDEISVQISVDSKGAMKTMSQYPGALMETEAVVSNEEQEGRNTSTADDATGKISYLKK